MRWKKLSFVLTRIALPSHKYMDRSACTDRSSARSQAALRTTKRYLPPSSRDSTSSFPVCVAHAATSFCAPGSVAIISIVAPGERPFTALLRRRMGSGQLRPVQSMLCTFMVGFLVKVKWKEGRPGDSAEKHGNMRGRDRPKIVAAKRGVARNAAHGRKAEQSGEELACIALWIAAAKTVFALCLGDFERYVIHDAAEVLVHELRRRVILF